MKKLSIILSCALGLLAASCDDAPATAPVQSNPQPPLMTSDDVASSPAGVLTATGLVKLQDYAATTFIPMMKVDKAVNIPDGAYAAYQIEIAKAADMAGSKMVWVTPREANSDLGFTPEEGVSYASTEEFNDAMMAIFGTGIQENTVYYRVIPYVVDEGANFRVGANDFYAASGTMTVTRTTPAVEVSPAYYLVGSFCDWDVARAVKFDKLDPTVDQYASPMFTLKVDLPASSEWKIIPQSSYEAGTLDNGFACNVAIGAKGTLEQSSGKEGAGSVADGAPYLFSIDMTERECTILFAVEKLYVATAGSSETNFSKMYTLGTADYINFAGISRMRTRFYLTGQPSNSGVVFSIDGEQTSDAAGKMSGKMLLTTSASEINKMPVADFGMYYLTANVSSSEYTATPINSISLIGAFNDWSLETAVEMTPAKTFLTWTGEITVADEGDTGFKFCCNGGWDINFGGTPDNIVVISPVNPQPADLTVPGPGTYIVTLKIDPAGCTATIVAK